ncbi:hypothetical protein D3C75_1091940 [compost metagenome]
MILQELVPDDHGHIDIAVLPDDIISQTSAYDYRHNIGVSPYPVHNAVNCCEIALPQSLPAVFSAIFSYVACIIYVHIETVVPPPEIIW